MAITASGLGSGLDIEGLVQQLVTAERAPLENRINRREADYQADLSAFGALKSAISTFHSTLGGIKSPATYTERKATVSDTEVFSATAGSAATPGLYQVEVSQLATSHALATAAYADTDTVVGEGTITLRFGTTTYNAGTDTYSGFALNADKAAATITIDSTNNTLSGVRDAINDANAGVNAVIVNDGSGHRLLLSGSDTGAASSLEISVAESGAAGLSALDFNASATNMTQTEAAVDAALSINGLVVSSADNTLSDTIEGVTLTLESTSTGPVSLEVERNEGAIKGAIESFVAAYNNMLSTFNELSSYDPVSGVAGLLLGDSTLRGIANSVRAEINSVVSGVGTYNTLASIGITSDNSGKLSLDSTELQAVIDQDVDALNQLFTAQGASANQDLGFVSASDETVIGDYEVVVSQLATQGQNEGLLSAGFAASMDIDGNNDTFKVKVDGISSGEIAIGQGTYANGDLLAAELQTKINGDTALRDAGVSVGVSYDSGAQRLVITSSRYGSASEVEFESVDTNTASTLGFSISAGTDGVDVAGTINGVNATGSGRELRAANGGDAAGLVVEVLGATTGSLGSLNFTRGVADTLSSLLDTFLNDDSILNVRTESLQARIEDLGDDRQSLERRMVTIEERYRSQFIALDTLLSQLRTTSDFLAGQLANLPGARSTNNS